MVTKRDRELFKLLQTHAILTTKQINEKLFRGVATTTVLRRLRILKNEKYISKIVGLSNFEVCWSLSGKGAEAIGAEYYKANFPIASLPHEVDLSRIRMILEDQGVARSWIPEHQIRSQMAKRHGLERIKSKAVPDGLMGFKHDGQMHTSAIELELHYKNERRYQDLFWSYSNKKNIKAIWYLVPTKSLGMHLQKLWRKHAFNAGGIWFFWSLVDEVKSFGSKAKLYYFDKTFLIENIFEIEQKMPAHPSGAEVSTHAEEISENKINLTP